MNAYQYEDDGYDDDGYGPKPAPRLAYVRGSEAEAGDFKPVMFDDALALAISRLRRLTEIGGNCDSPIEYHMGAAILLFFERAGKRLNLAKMVDLDKSNKTLLLVPQFAWSHYRSDWAIYSPKSGLALLVECDGKDFHTSPEARLHDQRKDEAAHLRGHLTMRFTGSQIHKDADGCAQKVYDAVYG